ncbi:hypothetical protein [Saliphagus sp. LR7]|uniref:glucosamine inositolphosphorylceramide transferase family protein n=1 Tax=Saliphagus sp. LR7 TaxID=2282654 RepID=UPI000DF7B2D7|nr:hypothetical protein [Saliphagus sp. LR7]
MTGPGSPVCLAIRARGPTLPAWQVACLRELRNADSADLRAILVDGSDPDGRDAGPAWRAYRSMLDRRLEALRPTDATAELEGTDRIRSNERAAERLSSAGVDVLLDFHSGPLSEAVRSAFSEGVWRFSPGDALPGLREIRAGEVTVRTALSRLDGAILREGVFPTVAHSAARTVDRVLFGMAGWPARAATDLAYGVTPAPSVGAADAPDRPAFEPGVREIGALLGRQARAIGAVVSGGSAGWTIGLTDRPIHEVARNPEDVSFEWIPRSDPRRFVADPFPARIDGESYLFFEEYDYETGLGTLSYLPLDGPLRLEAARPAFERPFHLSYPYCFEYQGEPYVIPETAMGGEVALYRLAAPDDWERVGTILDLPILDASVVEYGDRWWLFCTRLDDLPETNLHVYCAPSPTGEWTPHANNPVKTDVRSARPAGTPWIREGALYRPAQDCAGGYGRAIAINRVETLSPTAFEERRVGRIAPDPDGAYPDGRHTLSTDGEVTAIDANGSLLDAYHVSTQVRTVARTLSSAVTRRRT